MSIPNHLHLKRGDTVLATMTACAIIDMGLLACELVPSEAFAEFIPLFEEGRKLVYNAGTYNRDEDYAALNKWQDKLYKLGLSLIDPADGLALSWYLIHPISETEMQISWHQKVPAETNWNSLKS